MSTLARLHNTTQQLRAGRRVFCSSAPVAAYKVAHNTKSRLCSDQPLALALPAGERDTPPCSGSSGRFDLLEASVGPELRWDLTAVNHVVRTVSKHGEPTYLFSGIADTDPQAFVAVTFHKRTPPEEMQHLEGVLGRVCQVHVADTKPAQVPSGGQVVGALGKGLMKLLLGGGDSSSKHDKHEARGAPAVYAHTRAAAAPAYGSAASGAHDQAPRKSPEQERAEYLASLQQRPGRTAHEAGGAAGPRGRPLEQEGEEVPTAPVLPRDERDSAIGVSSRRDAQQRLAALKAELRGELPGAAPDTTYGAGRERDQAPHAHPGVLGRELQGGWQHHAPGVLSNPFTSTGGGRGDDARAPAAGAAAPPAAPSVTPATAAGMRYDNYLQREEESGGGGHARKSDHRERAPHTYAATAPAGPAAASAPYTQGMADWDRRMQQAAAAAAPPGPYGGGAHGGSSSAGRAPPSPERQAGSRVKYAAGARESWEEWQRVQHEAAAALRGGAPGAGGAGGYDDHEGGWGAVNRHVGGQQQQQQQPQYAYAGAGAAGGRDDERDQQRRGGGGGAPDWLQALGKVFAGGPGYANYAPDL